MTPNYPRSDLLNSAHAYPILLSYDTSLPSVGQDVDYFGIGQFRSAVKRSFVRSASSLAVSVSHVISVGSQKQMMRIYAGRDITAMKHMQTCGDNAEGLLPRYSVGPFVAKDYSVSLIGNRANPDTAPRPRDRRTLVLKKVNYFFSCTFTHGSHEG